MNIINFIVAGALVTQLHGSVDQQEKTLGVIGCSIFGETIRKVYPGSPAENNLYPGDKIVSVVGGEGATGSDGIDGVPYTTVTLTVRRRADFHNKYRWGCMEDQLITVTLTRVPFQTIEDKNFNNYFEGKAKF